MFTSPTLEMQYSERYSDEKFGKVKFFPVLPSFENSVWLTLISTIKTYFVTYAGWAFGLIQQGMKTLIHNKDSCVNLQQKLRKTYFLWLLNDIL